MDNQQYTPYSDGGQAVPPVSGNAAQESQGGAPHTSATQSAPQNPQNGGPYTAQNPYAQNGYGYGQTPPTHQNPYGQSPYHQNPYGQSPQYGVPPQYTQPPYTQNAYPYGQGYYSGYAVQTDPSFLKKKEESRMLRTMSMAHGLAVIGFTVFAYVLSGILAVIPGFRSAYMENSLFREALDAAFSVFIIFMPFFLNYLYQKKRGLLKELPLGTPNDGKAAILLVFIGVMCCVAGSYATGILTTIFENIFGVTFTMPENGSVYNSVPMVLLGVLGTAVVPALVEEFAIRGTVMQALRKYGDKFAIVMSALVFALMHGNMVQIPFAFIAGIAIGYAVTVSGSMWVGVAIHFLNNLMSVLMQAAVDTLPDHQENFVILGILALVFTLGVASLFIYLKNYAHAPLSKGNRLLSNGEKAKAYICTVPMILAAILLLIETARYIEF